MSGAPVRQPQVVVSSVSGKKKVQTYMGTPPPGRAPPRFEERSLVSYHAKDEEHVQTGHIRMIGYIVEPFNYVYLVELLHNQKQAWVPEEALARTDPSNMANGAAPYAGSTPQPQPQAQQPPQPQPQHPQPRSEAAADTSYTAYPPHLAYGIWSPYPPPCGPYFWPCMPPGYSLVPSSSVTSTGGATTFTVRHTGPTAPPYAAQPAESGGTKRKREDGGAAAPGTTGEGDA